MEKNVKFSSNKQVLRHTQTHTHIHTGYAYTRKLAEGNVGTQSHRTVYGPENDQDTEQKQGLTVFQFNVPEVDVNTKRLTFSFVWGFDDNTLTDTSF